MTQRSRSRSLLWIKFCKQLLLILNSLGLFIYPRGGHRNTLKLQYAQQDAKKRDYFYIPRCRGSAVGLAEGRLLEAIRLRR